MSLKDILYDEKACALFVYCAIRENVSAWHHLNACLKGDDRSWSAFLQLSPLEREKKYAFISHNALHHLERSLSRPEQILQHFNLLRKHRIAIISIHGKKYPARLRKEMGEEAPPFLFMKGNPELLTRTMIAIVGTRRASQQGLQATRKYAELLAHNNITIVSGGAAGIDTEAHTSALKAGGTTVIVVSSGLWTYRLAPRLGRVIDENRSLILSVFPPNEAFQKQYAIYRNSIIAALAAAAIVPETPLRSGTAYVIRHMLMVRRPLYSIIYTGQTPDSAAGNKSLLSAGAIPLPPQFSSPQKALDTILSNIGR